MEYFPPCSSYLWDLWGSEAPRGSIVERFVTVHVREEGIIGSGISVVPIGASKSSLQEHYLSCPLFLRFTAINFIHLVNQ